METFDKVLSYVLVGACSILFGLVVGIVVVS